MRRARIAVLGSANMDLVVTADRFPDAGETVTAHDFATIPGGKGANQALAAALLGADVSMLGAVGDDEFGDRIRTLLRDAGVRTDGLATSSLPTGTAHIVVDAHGENVILVVPGANGTVTGVGPGEAALLDDIDFLLLQLEISDEAVLSGARAARSRGARVILTPAPSRPLPPGLGELVDLIVANEHEAAQLTGRAVTEEALGALLTAVPEVVVTRGSRGCIYGAQGTSPVVIPAIPAHAVDTTAAGDTFVGALAVALGEGRAVHEALGWATAAAAYSVQHRGASTSMPSRDDVSAVLQSASRRQP